MGLGSAAVAEEGNRARFGAVAVGKSIVWHLTRSHRKARRITDSRETKEGEEHILPARWIDCCRGLGEISYGYDELSR